MIDVTEDGHDGCTTTLARADAILEALFDDVCNRLRFVDDEIDLEVHHDFDRLLAIEGTIDVRHHAREEELLDDLSTLHARCCREFLDGHGLRNVNRFWWFRYNIARTA